VSAPATTSELLTVLAARELARSRVVFAGHGLPTLAVSLAQLTSAPDIEIVYESGVTGAHPIDLPTSIADSMLVTGSEGILTMPQVFGYMIQGGRIDVGFLGAAQIDRYGSLNSTLIGGTYARPERRLPGSGGAIEVMAHAHEVFVVMRRHTPQTLVEQLDFVTSPAPSRSGAPGHRQASGRGVTRLITPLGVLKRGPDDDELFLDSVNPGVSVEQVRAATGWPLGLLREDLDPRRICLR
jgi:glutaconate CoA-transferase subunit B